MTSSSTTYANHIQTTTSPRSVSEENYPISKLCGNLVKKVTFNKTLKHVFLQIIADSVLVNIQNYTQENIQFNYLSRKKINVLKTNTLVIFNGTVQNSALQYGSVNFNSVTFLSSCIVKTFEAVMENIPSVVLSTHNTDTGNSAKLNFMYTWTRNITKYGMQICVQAVNSFVIVEAITVNYIALASVTNFKTSNLEQNIEKIVPGRLRLRIRENMVLSCQNEQFQHEFFHNPNIFISVGNEVIEKKNTIKSYIPLPFVWVRNLTTKGFEICGQHAANSNISLGISYITHGDINSCAFKKCPNNRECYIDKVSGSSQCECIKTCKSSSIDDVICGSDDVTYPSMCHMHQINCERFNHSKPVSIQHEGPCKSK